MRIENIDFSKKINFFFYKNFLKFNLILNIFIFSWIIEWIIIFENCFFKNNYNFYFFPSKIPVLLIICFLYNIYIWGISCWRRTQFGKFTRGDRELWSKSFASFWIFEIVTILSIFLAACWLRWGPAMYVPRTFYIGKKWFYIELIYFSYIVWLLYLLKLTMKWNNWENQIFIVYFILFFITLIIWRDIIIIYGRDYFSIKNGGKWKINKNRTIWASFAPLWWFLILINQVENDIDFQSNFFRLKYILKNFEKNNYFDIFSKDLNLIKLLKIKYMPLTLNKSWELNSMPLNDYFSTKYKISYTNFIENFFFSQGEFTLHSNMFYERRIGHHSKRITIWTLLFYIRIWHHLMLIFWWFFFLIRLNERKKSSYNLLSICHFNLYCCFLISGLIYFYRYLPMYEIIFKLFKIKFEMQKYQAWEFRRVRSWNYLLELTTNLFIYFRKSWSISMVMIDHISSYSLGLKNLYDELDLDYYDIIFNNNNNKNIKYYYNII